MISFKFFFNYNTFSIISLLIFFFQNDERMRAGVRNEKRQCRVGVSSEQSDRDRQTAVFFLFLSWTPAGGGKPLLQNSTPLKISVFKDSFKKIRTHPDS